VSIVIREVHLSTELEILKDIFNANFRIKGSAERFRWLYFDNPDGRATAWFVADERTGHIVGCTAVLPRRVRLAPSGSVVTAWNCGDFCVNAGYRTLGVALKLRRVAKEAVDNGRVPLLYAHPNDQMLQVHLRAGHVPMGKMIRHAKLLRPAGLSSLPTAAAAFALRFGGKELLVRRQHEADLVQDQVPEDVSNIYEQVADRIGTSLVRDQKYLEWRFRRCPVTRHEILITRFRGRATGYIAFASRDGVVLVKDWLAIDATARDQLFSALLRWARQVGAASVSVITLDTHPDIQALRRFGFVRRPEASTVITYAPPTSHVRSQIGAAAGWYMTVGDRDL